MSAQRAAARAHARQRLLRAASLGGYLLGLFVIVAVLNILARQSPLRYQFDATKTRAYSLSAQTERLLEGLEGNWTIALIMVEADVDRAVLRQMEEVLERFTTAAPSLRVVRIDPTDPASLGEYEALLASLRAIDGDLVQRYDQTLDRGVEQFTALKLFAQQQAGGLLQLTALGPEAIEPSVRQGLERRARLLALLADQGERVLEEVARARRVDDAQPIPDYEGARSTLAVALGQWAQELDDVARLLEQALERPDLDAELRRVLGPAGDEYDRMASALAAAADPLKHLEPLELSAIGRHLSEGEAAIVIGPRRAAVVPSGQLLRRTVHQLSADQPVTFDQRFRGEEILASAIRSLSAGRLPMVTFVHAEGQSLLQRREGDVDLMGAAGMLGLSRLDVREWIVGQGDRPQPDRGQRSAWIVLPPLRRGLEPAPHEDALIEATRTLLEEGQSVLLSLYPNHLARFKRADPWVELLRPFSLHADTSRVLFETRRVGEEAQEILTSHQMQEYPEGHAITQAIQGLRSMFSFPVAIETLPEAPGEVQVARLVEAPAGEGRWLEADWNRRPETVTAPPPAERLNEAIAIAVAAERRSPSGGAAQRLVVVGSGGWLLSRVADVAVGVGGDRFALYNPANVELLLASVYWLAGHDELIAPGPSSREVARLAGVSEGVRRRWFWLTVALLPSACLGLGVAVWMRRRV